MLAARTFDPLNVISNDLVDADVDTLVLKFCFFKLPCFKDADVAMKKEIAEYKSAVAEINLWLGDLTRAEKTPSTSRLGGVAARPGFLRGPRCFARCSATCPTPPLLSALSASSMTPLDLTRRAL
jgi:hypothetical protein